MQRMCPIFHRRRFRLFASTDNLPVGREETQMDPAFQLARIFFYTRRHRPAKRLMLGYLFQKISVFKPLKGRATGWPATVAQSTIATESS